MKKLAPLVVLIILALAGTAQAASLRLSTARRTATAWERKILAGSGTTFTFVSCRSSSSTVVECVFDLSASSGSFVMTDRVTTAGVTNAHIAAV